MLPRRVRSRLCQSCRNDLLALFQNGFGLSSRTPSTNSQKRWISSPRSLCKGKATRAFSGKPPSHDSKKESETLRGPTPVDDDVDVLAYHAQLAAIKQEPFFPKVGDLDRKGQEYTVEGLDYIAHRLWEKIYVEAFEVPAAAAQTVPSSAEEADIETVRQNEGEGPGPVGGESSTFANNSNAGENEELIEDDAQAETELRDPVEALRESDASVEEVVREARQVHGEYLPDGVLSEDESKTYIRLYGTPWSK